jgi:hypothetical protein
LYFLLDLGHDEVILSECRGRAPLPALLNRKRGPRISHEKKKKGLSTISHFTEKQKYLSTLHGCKKDDFLQLKKLNEDKDLLERTEEKGLPARPISSTDVWYDI